MALQTMRPLLRSACRSRCPTFHSMPCVASSSRLQLHTSARRLAEDTSPRSQPQSQGESPNESPRQTTSTAYLEEPLQAPNTVPSPAPSSRIPIFNRDRPVPTAKRGTTTPTFQTRTRPRTNTGTEADFSTDFPRYRPINEEPHPDITHILHIQSTKNNVFLTFTDGVGKIGKTFAGGTDRTFKGFHRSEPEAAHQACLKAMEMIVGYANKVSHEKVRIKVSFRGLMGSGRDACAQAIIGPTGDQIRPLIGRVEDKTKIKMGGTRSRKPRRV